jgi:hypothetical protein
VDSLKPLTAMLYGLVLGEKDGKSEINRSRIKQPVTNDIDQTLSSKSLGYRMQSKFFSIASATDLLLRARASQKPLQLQLMLGHYARIEKLSRQTE